MIARCLQIAPFKSFHIVWLGGEKKVFVVLSASRQLSYPRLVYGSYCSGCVRRLLDRIRSSRRSGTPQNEGKKFRGVCVCFMGEKRIPSKHTKQRENTPHRCSKRRMQLYRLRIGGIGASGDCFGGRQGCVSSISEALCWLACFF